MKIVSSGRYIEGLQRNDGTYEWDREKAIIEAGAERIHTPPWFEDPASGATMLCAVHNATWVAIMKVEIQNDFDRIKADVSGRPMNWYRIDSKMLEHTITEGYARRQEREAHLA